jgi:hypothetical protein
MYYRNVKSLVFDLKGAIGFTNKVHSLTSITHITKKPNTSCRVERTHVKATLEINIYDLTVTFHYHV